MRISKLVSAVFAVVGTVLLAGSVVMSFVALSKPSTAVAPTQEANDFAQSVLSVLNDGNFADVAGFFYGRPSLELDREPATAEGKQIWNAYRDSITVTADEGCCAEGTTIYQTAQVTALDISEALSRLNGEAAALLSKRLETAEDPAALLDENEEVPQALKDELRCQALTQVLADAKTVTTRITFQLVEKDGQWWVLPDQAMLDVLSGGPR